MRFDCIHCRKATTKPQSVKGAFLRMLTDFEYRSKKQAEALERARLLNEQAELLRKEADKLGKP